MGLNRAYWIGVLRVYEFVGTKFVRPEAGLGHNCGQTSLGSATLPGKLYSSACILYIINYHYYKIFIIILISWAPPSGPGMEVEPTDLAPREKLMLVKEEQSNNKN